MPSADFIARISDAVRQHPGDALPTLASVSKAETKLPDSIPQDGIGDEATLNHLLNDLTPAFNGPKLSANYYGFVTGGVLPVAEAADYIVTAFDQNVQVHLPQQTVSTTVEARALSMLVELLGLGDEWKGRTFTTGATGSNILALACGREAVIKKQLASTSGANVSEIGIIAACAEAGIKEIQVLTTMGHSSLFKAASVVGLGHKAVKDLGQAEKPWKFDIVKLEEALQREGVASIVVLSLGEVNTGRYATDDMAELSIIRSLCDTHGAWLHADAAFGLFGRALPSGDEFEAIHKSIEGLPILDSITGDAHKCLNVPYDCGIFLTRSLETLTAVFQNPNAAYLTAGGSDVPSPLNIGLENSRRFRALPVYSVLLSLGRSGLSDLFAQQIRLARHISKYIHASTAYELLPNAPIINWDDKSAFNRIGIIVLFRARDPAINRNLVHRINDSKKIYVSGTSWEGQPACRFAISTWKVAIDRDLELITKVLEQALR